MREWDLIESLISESISLLKQNKGAECLLKLMETRGAIQVYLTEDNVWDLAREDYEQGITPKQIALKHGLKAKVVTSRAYDQNWISPRKVEKALKKDNKASRKGNSFIHPCIICEQKFQTASGNNHTCDQCRARKVMDAEFGRQIHKNDFFY